MSVHQCPKCELRFDWKTELDDHCRHDHPEFRHEYPAEPPPRPSGDHTPRPAPPLSDPHPMAQFARWLIHGPAREKGSGARR